MSDSPNGVHGNSLYSLDGVPGLSPVVAARFAKADHERLTRLAEHFGVPLSRVVRVALLNGLVDLETSGVLPDDNGQGATPDNTEGAR